MRGKIMVGAVNCWLVFSYTALCCDEYRVIVLSLLMAQSVSLMHHRWHFRDFDLILIFTPNPLMCAVLTVEFLHCLFLEISFFSFLCDWVRSETSVTSGENVCKEASVPAQWRLRAENHSLFWESSLWVNSSQSLMGAIFYVCKMFRDHINNDMKNINTIRPVDASCLFFLV